MTIPNPLLDLDRALAAAVTSVSPSILHVRRGRGGGTGIAWSEDLAISSSFHTPDKTKIHLGNDEELFDAEVIGRDPGTDVALLRVAGTKLTPATFRDIDDLGVGNLAFAIGRPGRTVRASMRAIGVLGPSLRTHHNGKLDRYVESDRQIPRGFAGGPLIDVIGRVIGMNTRTLLRGSDVAVPTATLRRVVDELRDHGGIRRGYLGIGAYPAQLATGPAALIVSVDDDGPAAKAGLLVGDVLLEIDGTAVTGPDTLRQLLADRPGATVKLVALRGGQRLEVDATLGSQP